MLAYKKVLIVGAGGAIGNALLMQLLDEDNVECIYALSSQELETNHPQLTHIKIDYADLPTLESAASKIAKLTKLDLVIVTTGILHNANLQPEKSLKQISFESLQQVFMANTIVPVMCAKYFLPLLDKNSPNVFAALSARVGSITDNRLGGWHAYRASKAALNMLIKNISIENRLANKNNITVGLHPGTVDSNLSAPFQKNVAANKLFTPAQAASYLLEVIGNLTATDSGSCIAWDGKTIDA